ncbi:RimK family alpha-L-glutamate ligase [Glycomyces sp. YM15]|uniref:ATP-grasp domain-containing protein n=1 Tax=Glycomyces sp. YM15 TaxID=2800446 RepID=UPI00196614CD|nr:RimK family alpha-L-glutamate ligase [Glycomyces sp. YM15]
MNLRVAVVADRVSWEERQLIAAAPDANLELTWVNDESLCLGAEGAPALAAYDAVLVRSRSYTRGGLIATAAEAAGVRVCNAAKAIRACENKLELRTEMHRAGIPAADHRLVLSRRDFELALGQIPPPFVLKPIYGGMGKRVTLVRTADTAQSVYDYVEDLGHGFEQAMLVEPFLDGGTSIRCFVVGREIVAAAEFASAGGDWRSNAALGNQTRALPRDPALAKIVDDVVDVLGPGVYGIDLFRSGGDLIVNEVNHAPAFRAVAESTGVDVPRAIVNHLREELS